MPLQYTPHSPSLEVIADDERETFEEIAKSFRKMGEDVAANEGRAVRVSHAKSTGLLKAELEVSVGLPPELAQGLFAAPGRYEALVRLAQGPGENLRDRVSTHRGMAIKVLGVSGERAPQSPAGDNQDWVLEAKDTAFINADAKQFLLNLKGGVANAPKLPEGVKEAVSDISRVTNAALEAVGGGSKMLGFFGHEPVHPLSEAYFSQAPIRWGDYVGKLGVFPTEQTIASLDAEKIDNAEDDDAFRHAVVRHFEAKGAEFEIRVQLMTDPDAMPVENASKVWPEEESPYRTVGVLRIAPQAAWTPTRSAYVDGKVSFQPARALAAHRPLGQVMRARMFVYDLLVAFRTQHNGEPVVEPAQLSDVPG